MKFECGCSEGENDEIMFSTKVKIDDDGVCMVQVREEGYTQMVIWGLGCCVMEGGESCIVWWFWEEAEL